MKPPIEVVISGNTTAGNHRIALMVGPLRSCRLHGSVYSDSTTVSA